MLRLVVVVLVLANAFFFAWTRGWLAPLLDVPTHGERNPERLSQQVRPEVIGVLGARAASAAVSAARAASMAAGEGEMCLELGPFTMADVGAAEALLVQAGVAAEQWVRREQARSATWGAIVGPLPTAEAQRGRSDALRKLNIAAELLAEPAELKGALLLGRHGSREAVDAALPAWAERGVRDARAAQLVPAGSEQWLRFERTSSAQRQQLRQLPWRAGAALAGCNAAR